MNHAKMRKMRIEQGGFAIIDELKPYSADDLIIESYVHTEHPKAKRLTNMYDHSLLLAKTEPQEYIRRRPEIVAQIAKYIKEHQLYREWMDLVLIVTENIQNDRILNAYMSDMMDTWRELSYSYPNQLICGLTSTNELLRVTERFGDWDIPLLRLREKVEKGLITKEQFAKKMAEMRNVEVTAKDENLWTIELFGMMPFINERTVKIIPKKYLIYSIPNWKLPEKWRGTKIYQEALAKRKYMIGRKGVRVRFKMKGDVSELFLMEDIDRNNQLVMLFQLHVKDKGALTGYYQVKQKEFFTCYRYSTIKAYHEEIENLVLGVYASLVSELDLERKRSYRIEEVSSLEQIPNEQPNRIYYELVAIERESDGTHEGEKRGNQRPHFRSFALRKLGDNQHASEEAKQRASEYGIEIQEGYTFVRAYAVGRTEAD